MEDITRQNHFICFRHIDPFISTDNFNDFHLERAPVGKLVYGLVSTGFRHLKLGYQKGFVEPYVIALDAPFFLGLRQGFLRKIG